MRVAVYYSNQDIRLEDRPVPAVGPGEVLVRVRACGVCGSDVLEWYRRPRAPVVLGHEIAGEVVEVGAGVPHLRPGDRVVVAHHVPCGACIYCHAGHETVCPVLQEGHVDPGGFAEYVRVPALQTRRGLFPLPDSLTWADGAMVEPLGCVLRGQRQARLEPGQSVVVIGCGVAGLLHVQAARALGAGPVLGVEPDPFRREMALRMGASAVWHPEDDVVRALRSHLDGRPAQRVIVCTSAPAAVELALRCVDRGGTVLFFAPMPPEATVTVPFNDLFWRNEVTLTSSYGAAPADMQRALDLLRWGRVSVREVVTHRFPLGDIAQAFHLVARPRESLKVLVEP